MNLPPVIEVIDKNPIVVSEAKDQKHEEKEDLKDFRKRIVLCITKDIPDADKNVLSSYGRLLYYDALYNNIDTDKIAFDYLVIDLRKSSDRYYAMRYVLNNPKCYTVVYHYAFETDELMQADNSISSFPQQQPSKQAYDELLLSRRIKKPQAVVSAFKCCLGIYKDIK